MTSIIESKGYVFSGKINHRLVELFYVDGTLPNHTHRIDHTLRFIAENFTNGNSFTDMLLGSPLSQNKLKRSVYDAASKMHEDDRRKATRDPYMKHVLYTAYISHEIAKGKEYEEPMGMLALWGSLFHDAVEMKKKRRPRYSLRDFDEDLQDVVNLESSTRRKLMIMTDALTPLMKKKGIPLNDWYNHKRMDWGRIVNITEERVMKINHSLNEKLGRSERISRKEAEELAQMIVDIKFADEIANIVETYDDMVFQRDGHSPHKGLRSLKARVNVFNERAKDISQRYKGETFEIKMCECLKFLNDSVGNFRFK